MTKINYSEYTIEQLRSSLSGIDREKYPDRVQEIEKYLEDKLSNPDLVVQSKVESDFFNSHVPSGIVTSIWFGMFGWSLVTAFVVGLPLTLFLTLILPLLGLDEWMVLNLTKVLYWLVCLAVSWLFLRRLIGNKHAGYEIVFIRKEN